MELSLLNIPFKPSPPQIFLPKLYGVKALKIGSPHLIADIFVRGCQLLFNPKISSAAPVFPTEVQGCCSYTLTDFAVRIQGRVLYRECGTLEKGWIKLPLLPMSQHIRALWHRQG